MMKSSTRYILRGMVGLGLGLLASMANALQPPAAPTGLMAAISAKAPLAVNLAWKDNAANETGYTIQRASNVYFKTGLVTFTAGANARAFTDTSVQINNTYYYRIQARNATGASAWSNIASAAATAPAAPESLMGMELPLSSNAPTAKLAWRDNASNESGFTIQRAANSSFTKSVQNFTIGANGKGYIDTPLPKHQTFYYRVRAFNGAGPSAWSNTVQSSTPGELPDKPVKLIWAGSTRKTVSLRWTDGSSDERGFYLERSTAGFNGPWKRIAAIKADMEAFKDAKLTPNCTYWYRLQAFNSTGGSGYTNWVSGKTQR